MRNKSHQLQNRAPDVIQIKNFIKKIQQNRKKILYKTRFKRHLPYASILENESRIACLNGAF